MRSLLIEHPSFLAHEMAHGHPECPERLVVIRDRLVRSGVVDLMDRVSAPLVSVAAVSRAHDPTYLEALEALAPQAGYAAIDPDTRMNAYTLQAAMHAAGAAEYGALQLLNGTYDRVFCAVRPPGHHAERGRAMGFCFLNNAAVAALALRAGGLERVAVIDFDVHHGNGTEDILADVPGVLMVSTFQRDLYPFSGEHPQGNNMLNVALPAYSDGRALRAAVAHTWLPALDAFKPQALVVSAGFDAHRADDLGQLGWVDDDFFWVTQELVALANRHAAPGHAGKILSTLEGGYDLAALARCTEVHLNALIERH